MEKQYAALTAKSTPAELNSFGKDLLILIQGFRSPKLGIGNEALKQNLRDVEQQVMAVQGQEGQLATYGSALGSLSKIVSQLDQDDHGIRLNDLRSVRNYKTEIFSSIPRFLMSLKKMMLSSTKRVSSCRLIWFFNNQELSTRALEKQDPEALQPLVFTSQTRVG